MVFVADPRSTPILESAKADSQVRPARGARQSDAKPESPPLAWQQSNLWLAVRPFGNMRGDPFQDEFADQIRHSIRARVRQAIQKDQ